MTSRLRIVARAYPRATPGTLDTLSYDYQDGRLVLQFSGATSSQALLVEVPSFYRGFHLTSSDPARAVSAQLNSGDHLLTIRIAEHQLHHRLVIHLTAS
jgi:hypothetical protein